MSFYSNQTVNEYSKRFKSPLLQLLLESIVGTDYNATALIFTLGTFAAGDGGYPEGGSLSMANRMAKRFESLGGTIQYGKPVSKVSVQNGIANGVIINSEYIKADAVIVTQDTLVAIDSLFDPPISEPWAERMRKTTKPVLNTFISVGVEADLTGVPERVGFMPEKPLVCGGVEQPVIGICNYAGYKGYAPDGCTAVTSIIMGDTYDYWKKCKDNGTYQEEKKKLAEAFIEILAKKYPKTAGKIAVWDVATPLTYERYLGSYKGSWMSIMGKGKFPKSYPSKPESIKNVYFASQRLSGPGGTPVAVDSGRTAVQYLCKDTNTVFQGNSTFL
jgi:phytoene dehydrogenase-like protein